MNRDRTTQNRPGLSQLSYRIGDYHSFRQRLFAALPQALKTVNREAPLAKLTTRDASDPAIALLDAWAVVADVLTFYQERIANEGFLRTATERRSVLELARAIAYELDPGVAASTYLSFVVEDAPGSPPVVPIPARTQIMSVPIKDELPQIFETTADVIAYLAWNNLRPRSARPQRVQPHTRQLYLEGTSTQLQAGDLLLLVDRGPDPQTFLLPLQSVEPDTGAGYTRVRWHQSLPPMTTPLRYPQVLAFRQQARLFGFNAPPWEQMPAEIKLAAVEKSGGAIAGGVFRSDSDGLIWTAASQGLPDSDILCMAARDNMLFVGTPDKGIFRSSDNGQTWEAANEGLISLNVLALHIAAKNTVFNAAIFAGTPNGGVFRSRDQGQNWVAINQGTVRSRRVGDSDDEWEAINTSLPATVVRSLVTYTSSTTLGSGTLYGEGVDIRGENTAFTSQLFVGETITVSGQSRTVTSINSDTSITIDDPFEFSNLPAGTAFSAQVVISYSFTVGPVSTNSQITDTVSSGTISSFDNTVQGVGTNFLRLSQDVPALIQSLPDLSITSRQITITENGQQRTVVNVLADNRLAISDPFTRNFLDPGTPFSLPRTFTGNYIFVGTDEGVYRSHDLGQTWLPRGLSDRAVLSLYHTDENNIIAGTDIGIFYSSNDGENWSLVLNSEGVLNPEDKVFSLTSYGIESEILIFAGTDAGVFRSLDGGENWEPINTVQASDLGGDLESLADKEVRSLATYRRGGTRYLFAATNDGVFVSINSSDGVDQLTWQRIGQELAAQDTTTLALDGADETSSNLYMGTRFGDFLAPPVDSASEPLASAVAADLNQPDWPRFVIQEPRQLDLEALYPQWLEGSWVVLVDDRNPQNPEQRAEPRYSVRQIEAIAAIDRQDFGLTGKLTRLAFTPAIDPAAFGLRSAQVLGRSTELPLALEPLTVEERQHEIFADPLVADTLYLQDFVANLQPKQVVMVSGQPMGVVLSDVGGILRSRYPWQPLNGGLNDLTINALASSVNGNLLLAATNDGLYGLAASSPAAVEATGPNNSAESAAEKTWAPLPGLRFKTVHSIFSSATLFLVGADLELYRASSPNDKLVNVDLPIEATVLTVLASDLDRTEAGEITSISGITLKIPESSPALTVGTVITVEGQTRIITEVQPPDPVSPTDDAGDERPPGLQTVLINRVFEPEISVPQTFELGGSLLMAGTDRGILRSTDDGKTWEYLKSLRDRRVYCLLARVSDSSLEVYAGTDQGLQLSSDSGQSWSRLETLWDQQAHPEIYALAQSDQALEIWIGTGRGIYHLGADVNTEPRKLNGLCDRAILSLTFTVDGNTLYAGTDQGIYRSPDQGQTWDALDPGLGPATGRALLLLPHLPHSPTPHLLVGTEAGLFATPGHRQDPIHWSRSNTGLVNSQVTTLASSPDGTTLLAGTLAGLYRSTSGGRTWAPFDDGLEPANGPDKLKMQAIARTEAGHWLVGTPAGVYGYGPVLDDPDGAQAWQVVGRDTLTYPDVLALALQGNWLLVGTVNGGLFKLNVTTLDFSTPQGQPMALRWQPTGLNNTDVDAIAVVGDRIYAGTIGDGIFRSTDRGSTWEQITQTRQGQGTLASDGTSVTWSGTRFNLLLQPGDVITAAGQTRTITGAIRLPSGDPAEGDLPGATSVGFTVDAPFRPTLPPNTRFTIATGLTNLEITALAYQEEEDTDGGGIILYAGTAGSGVFRSTDGGDRWQPVIANLDNLDIRCLLFCADENVLWAGTATTGVADSGDEARARRIEDSFRIPQIHTAIQQRPTTGVFRSINQGDLWTSVSLNLTNTDVRALLRPTQSTLLVGGIGCLRSADGLTVKPVQRHDRVQVVQAPQPITAQPDSDQRWHLRDKDGFLGTLDTTAEQVFPLLPAEEEAPLVSEQAQIKHPPTDQQQPVLILQDPLTYSYDPATVTVVANVVPATHGETALEVLGSGDGTTSNPTFVLKKPPLTYVVATNARGSDSTLEVRVDGVLWEEVSALYARQPQAQAYIIRIDDDGTTTVTFGDGVRGSRPPSGQENITARYRSGIGTEGNVTAGQLTILKTRPQGIAEVTNPLAATGAADRESLEAARTNAPPTARTLGRIVSLQDFQDFAQGFVGIGKAQAVALWDGSAPVVHITIAGADGAPVPETSALYRSLLAAIDQARDPTQQVQVASYRRLFFNVEARVLLDARYLEEAVEPQLVQVLGERFSFQHRGFGQGVTSAEVITALQAVEGVIAVDLAALYQVGRSRALNASLGARTAVYDPDTETIQPAQLFGLSPVGLQVSFVSTL